MSDTYGRWTFFSFSFLFGSSWTLRWVQTRTVRASPFHPHLCAPRSQCSPSLLSTTRRRMICKLILDLKLSYTENRMSYWVKWKRIHLGNINYFNVVVYVKAVCSFLNGLFLRFRTPTLRRSIMECSPRTPTPFKSALTLQDTKYGPLKRVRVCVC